MAWIFHSLCGSNTTLSSIELKKKEKKSLLNTIYHAITLIKVKKHKIAQKWIDDDAMLRYTGIHVQLVEHEMRQIHKAAVSLYISVIFY